MLLVLVELFPLQVLSVPAKVSSLVSCVQPGPSNHLPELVDLHPRKSHEQQ